MTGTITSAQEFSAAIDAVQRRALEQSLAVLQDHGATAQELIAFREDFWKSAEEQKIRALANLSAWLGGATDNTHSAPEGVQ